MLDEFQKDPQRVEQRSPEELLAFLKPDVEETQEERREQSTDGGRIGGPPIPPPDPALREFWDPRTDIFHPRSTEHVRLLLDAARNQGKRVRVLGSQHSVRDVIFGASQDFTLLLDGELRKIELLESRTADGFNLVRVGAGCYLGPNPADPSQRATDTLTRWLDARGFAFPITGGITHQTIAGFIQTGSDGGSLMHSFSDAVEELELVDGKGEVRTFRRGTNEFAAAGVSMGLFGVITHVTLKVGTSYWVEGEEGNQELEDSLLAPGLGGDALVEALRTHEYLRLNWYPQKNVQRVTLWKGKQVAKRVGPRDPYEPPLRDEFSNLMAALVLRIINGSLGLDPDSDLTHQFIGALMKPFLPLGAPQTFRDAWHLTLPMDDTVRTDDILRVLFTELWFPLDKADEVLGILRELLADQRVAGNLAVELYAGKPSPFWLSPAHEGGSLRVDPYRWAYDEGVPEDLFEQYWKRLLDVGGVRLHWGKYLPLFGTQYGQTVFDLQYLRKVYPRMDDWLEMRLEMDPDGLFLNPYWESLLLSVASTQETDPVVPKEPPADNGLLVRWAKAATVACLTLFDKLYGVAVRE
ncbi:MAG TPA: D-arabinono-1,4-lactone oxidase [Archangium sp.]